MKVSLNAARVNAELTRREVAKKLGFSIDTLKSIENGKRDVKVSELNYLCSMYKIRISYNWCIRFAKGSVNEQEE